MSLCVCVCVCMCVCVCVCVKKNPFSSFFYTVVKLYHPPVTYLIIIIYFARRLCYGIDTIYTIECIWVCRSLSVCINCMLI